MMVLAVVAAMVVTGRAGNEKISEDEATWEDEQPRVCPVAIVNVSE